MEEPVAKRPRLDDGEQPELSLQAAEQGRFQQQQQQQGPSIQSLFQVPAGLPREPSPGAMHGCRIATWARAEAEQQTFGSAIATGARVFWSQVAVQQPVQPDQGKEGILLPKRLQAAAVMHLSDILHAGEVQALSICQCLQDSTTAGQQQQAQLLLGSVDAFGLGSISRLQVPEQCGFTAEGKLPAAVAPTVLSQVRLKPQDNSREGGWAGIAFSSSSSSSDAGLLVATARGFAKDVTLYDAATGGIVRTYHCGLNPYALRFLPAGLTAAEGQLLAVAESHMVSLWDARSGGASGGCVQRLATGSVGQPLFALDWCTAQTGLLGSAGAERSVFLTEPRKWNMLTKWGGATRLAIHSLAFLESDPHYAVLAGLDMEVLCGRWDKANSNSRAFQPIASGEDGRETNPAAAAALAAPAAPGAPGSGDRTRGSGDGTAAAAAALGEAGGAAAGGLGFSFRGDSRWLGVCKAAGEDVLAGFAASGNLVYGRVG